MATIRKMKENDREGVIDVTDIKGKIELEGGSVDLGDIIG